MTKKEIAIFMLAVALIAIADLVASPKAQPTGRNGLQVSMEYAKNGDRIYLIEDHATKAHCVAITTDLPDINGYAISCLPSPK